MFRSSVDGRGGRQGWASPEGGTGVGSCDPVRAGHTSGSCRVPSPLYCVVTLGPRPEPGRRAVVAAPGFSIISGSAARAASVGGHLRPGRHLGCELADPAHPLGGRVGVVAELFGHPANAPRDAEPPHGSRDCICCHCGGRGVRSLQPRGEQRRAPRAGRGLPHRGTAVGQCGGVRMADGCHHELSARAWGRRARPVRRPGVLACAARAAGPAPEPARSSVASSWVSSGAELSFLHL